ncbi:hypothetical protein G9A89_017463 [Geosiphon pyriformis]|nr:hypothetical protein G9A89_017463 [Geosiphon pyriformis]
MTRTVERIAFATLGALSALAIAYRDVFRQKKIVPDERPRAVKEFILPFGFPSPITEILYRTAYVASYNRQLRNPVWVAEHITPDTLKTKTGVDRGKSSFQEDLEIPKKFRVTIKDYFRSGYDRGHMVPAADIKFSQQAMDETFLMTNISPQVGNGFNRDYWAHLEEFCRRLVKKAGFSDVYVFSGPLYLPKQDQKDEKWYVNYEVIGEGHDVAVPNHFYKVILATKDQKQYALGAFILPNSPIPNNTPLEKHEVPLEILERAAGITFFEGLDKEKTIPLCKATSCVLVANPKYLEAKGLKALPQLEKDP